MIILILEAAFLVVLTILAINYGAMLWILWLIVLVDSVFLLFRIHLKLKKKRAPSGTNAKEKTAGLTQLPNKSSNSLLAYTLADNQPLPHLDETFCYSGQQFECYVATVYMRLGYRLVSAKKSCDQGIDIIVKHLFSLGIQAKCYSRPVGNKAVQEAAAGKRFYGLRKAVVVTNGIFTDSAKALAAKNKITLIDRVSLAAMIKKANQKHGFLD